MGQTAAGMAPKTREKQWPLSKRKCSSCSGRHNRKARRGWGSGRAGVDNTDYEAEALLRYYVRSYRTQRPFFPRPLITEKIRGAGIAGFSKYRISS